MSLLTCFIFPFKIWWHCANLFQPIKGFHFLRLYRIRWAICEDRCLYIGINIKQVFPTSTPLAIYLVYPLTVLYLWSRFIWYLVLLCYIIYIQSKSYVNVYITLKEILLQSHEIMLISANWHLIGHRNIAMICHLPHASWHQIKSIGVKCIGTWRLWLAYQTVRLTQWP